MCLPTKRLPVLGAALSAALLAFASAAHATGWGTVTVRKNNSEISFSYAELESRWPRLLAEQKILVLMQMIEHGKFDLAQRYLDRTKFGGGSALDARFIQAQIYKNKGRLQDAADEFRGILKNHPDNQPTRVALAHTLFLMKEDESARHHFELALGSANNRDLENNIRRFIDQMNRRRRWNMGAYMSLAPSTNFNQGTDAKFVYLNGIPLTISDSGKAKSGVGVLGGVNGGYRFAVTDRFDFVVGGGFNFKEYKADTFDDHSIGGQIGPRYNFTFGHVGLYATASRRWFGRKGYSKSRGVRGQVGARLHKRALMSATAGYDRNLYDTATHMDGNSYYGSGYVDYFLTPNSYLRGLAGGHRGKTSRAHLDYVAWHAGAGYYTELAYGVSLYGEVKYTWRDYDGVFPGITEERSDRQLDLKASLTKRDWSWKGFAPKFEYAYTRNISNVVFYDYDAHSANITLTKKF